MFYIAIKGFKAKNHYGGRSTFLCGILFTIFGFYNLIFGYFPFPYTGFMIYWIGIILSVYFVFAFIIKRIKKKMELEKLGSGYIEHSKLRKYIMIMTKENLYKQQLSIKRESIRKSFHLAGILFIFSYFGFFFLFPLARIVNDTVIVIINDSELMYNIFWGDIDDYPYEKGDFQAVVDITIFGLVGGLVFMVFSDIIRILWGPEFSIFNLVTKSILRDKEYSAAGAHIYLMSGIIFSYTLFIIGYVHILTVTAAILIACFSDALAALIGRKFGKCKVNCIGGEIKSVEGFIAGTASAFLIGLIIVGPIYALFAALIFFLLDLVPTIIADNLLNPIAITIGITIVVMLIGAPIGWF
ncbi:MAG: hypothetical protein ACFFAN_14115 [Promethearchaeota archaeon]